MEAFYIDYTTSDNDSATLSRGSRKRMALTSLVGDAIFNPAGENLGRIKDIILDLSTGRIDYIVIEFGGFLGMNQKYLAVPLGALTVAKEHANAFILDESRDSLKAYPVADVEHWAKADADGQ